MNPPTVTVHFNGKILILSRDYADLNGITDGHIIKTQAEYMKVLRGHVAHELRKKRLIDAAWENKN